MAAMGMAPSRPQGGLRTEVTVRAFVALILLDGTC